MCQEKLKFENMGLWKSIGSMYILAWIIHWTSFWLVKRHATGYFRLHVMHLEAVIKVELLMILGSFFIWRRITSLLFETISPKHKDIEENGESQKGRRLYRHIAPAIGSSKKQKYIQIGISIFLALFLFCAHLSQFVNYFANSVEPRMVSLVCLTSFGMWIHLVFFLVGFSFVNFVVRFIYSKPCGQAFLTPIFVRCPFIQQLLINSKLQTTASILLSTMFTVCLLITAGHPRIKRVEIPLNKLPRSWDGTTIALLTDLHAGPTVGRSDFVRAVEMVNAEKPDIVTIVGDLVDGTLEDLKEVVEPIGQLKAKYGVYFSTGNHEMYYGRLDDWLSYLATLNIKVMRNENVKIRHQHTDDKKQDAPDDPYLCLAGADDIFSIKANLEGHRMDLRAAINGCSTHSPTILMAHNPKAAKQALELEQRIDLILCGHTHAGQLYVLAPFMYMMMPFFYGLYSYHPTDTYVYVSSGVFYMGMPMKMIAMSEITLITLRSANVQ